MSLREEIEEIMQDGAVAFLPAEQIVMMKTDTSERVINKVLDAAVEAVEQSRKEMWKDAFAGNVQGGIETAIKAINKLRGEK